MEMLSSAKEVAQDDAKTRVDIMFTPEAKRRVDIIYTNLLDMMVKQKKTHVALLDTPHETKKDQDVREFFRPSSSRKWISFYPPKEGEEEEDEEEDEEEEEIQKSNPFERIKQNHRFSSRLAYCCVFCTSKGKDLSKRKDELDKDTVVVFMQQKQSNTRESEDVLGMLLGYEWKRIYVITPVELTSNKKKTVENGRLAGISIIPYIDHELAISVLKHAFSPSIWYSYKPSETKEFREKEKIDPSKIPLIKQSDPIARALDLSKGQIIIEKIPGTTTEIDIVYRKVVL